MFQLSRRHILDIVRDPLPLSPNLLHPLIKQKSGLHNRREHDAPVRHSSRIPALLEANVRQSGGAMGRDTAGVFGSHHGADSCFAYDLWALDTGEE